MYSERCKISRKMFLILEAFEELRQEIIVFYDCPFFYPSVRLPSASKSDPAGRIFVKCDMWLLLETV